MSEREKIIHDMCLTWRHDYGLVKQEDEPKIGCGMFQVDRVNLFNSMAQVYDNNIAPELATLRGELEEVKYDRSIKHDLAAEQIEAIEAENAQLKANNAQLTAERDAAHAAGRREAVESIVGIAKSAKWSDKPCYCMKPEYICLPCLYSAMFVGAIRAEFGGEE